MTYINLLLISWIVVFIVDLTDFPSNLKKLASWILTKGAISTDGYRFHLWDCSLCISWWIGLIYLLIAGKFTIGYIAFLALVAAATRIEESIFNLLEDIIFSVIKRIEKLL